MKSAGRKKAEQGDAGAQYDLGLMYDNGQGVAQNYKEAVKWYKHSAEQGHAEAQNALGIVYANGQSVSQDYEEAVNTNLKLTPLVIKSPF